MFCDNRILERTQSFAPKAPGRWVVAERWFTKEELDTYEILSGALEGDLEVTRPVLARGRVRGDVRVGRGGHFVLSGSIAGTLTVEVGGEAEVNGEVGRDAVNRGGCLIVRGVVKHAVRSDNGYTVVEPGAFVNGDQE